MFVVESGNFSCSVCESNVNRVGNDNRVQRWAVRRFCVYSCTVIGGGRQTQATSRSIREAFGLIHSEHCEQRAAGSFISMRWVVGTRVLGLHTRVLGLHTVW